jgi:hypothetical protein
MVLCGIFMLIIKKDHKSWFERNDLFFIIYAVPSWLLIMFGMMNQFGIPGLVLVFYFMV